MTRLWVPGKPIPVTADELGTPVWFTWERRRHHVVQVAGRWRIDEAWWSQRIWREYFLLITKSGILAVVYRDFVTGRWFLQKVYD